MKFSFVIAYRVVNSYLLTLVSIVLKFNINTFENGCEDFINGIDEILVIFTTIHIISMLKMEIFSPLI